MTEDRKKSQIENLKESFKLQKQSITNRYDGQIEALKNRKKQELEQAEQRHKAQLQRIKDMPTPPSKDEIEKAKASIH